MDNLSKYINIYNRCTWCGQVDEVLKRRKTNTCHMYNSECLGVIISAWGDDNYRTSSCVPCGRIINKKEFFFRKNNYINYQLRHSNHIIFFFLTHRNKT